MRLFVAINLPPEERLRLHAATAPLREISPAVRWVEPETMHITLKFLGEVSEQRQFELEQALQQAAAEHGPFDLELTGIGAFPNLQRSRVYWVGAQRPEAMQRLQASVEQAFGPLGFPAEARAFHPHLTLGRVKAPLPTNAAEALARAAETVAYRAAVPIETVDLMRSHVSSRGARYEPVARIELSGD